MLLTCVCKQLSGTNFGEKSMKSKVYKRQTSLSVRYRSVVSSSIHIKITILRCRCVNNNMLSLHEYGTFNFKRIWDLIVSVPDHCLSFYFKFT